MNTETVLVTSLVIRLSNGTLIEYDGSKWKIEGIMYPRHMRLVTILDEAMRQETR